MTMKYAQVFSHHSFLLFPPLNERKDARYGTSLFPQRVPYLALALERSTPPGTDHTSRPSSLRPFTALTLDASMRT